MHTPGHVVGTIGPVPPILVSLAVSVKHLTFAGFEKLAMDAFEAHARDPNLGARDGDDLIVTAAARDGAVYDLAHCQSSSPLGSGP